MVCWHRRYSLGDAHDYDSPIDFLRDLYRHSISDNAQRLVQYLKEKKARGAYLQYNRSTHEWDLYGYYSLRTVLGNSEPEWEIAESAPASQLNAGGWFFDAMLDVLTIDDLKELAERKDVPHFTAVSVRPQHTEHFHRFIHWTRTACRMGFRSGWLHLCRTHRHPNGMAQSLPKTMNRARQALEAEVKAYDAYLRGECYGYRLYKDGEEIDSCWGFLGDIDELKDYLRVNLPPEGAELVEN